MLPLSKLCLQTQIPLYPSLGQQPRQLGHNGFYNKKRMGRRPTVAFLKRMSGGLWFICVSTSMHGSKEGFIYIGSELDGKWLLWHKAQFWSVKPLYHFNECILRNISNLDNNFWTYANTCYRKLKWRMWNHFSDIKRSSKTCSLWFYLALHILIMTLDQGLPKWPIQYN